MKGVAFTAILFAIFLHAQQKSVAFFDYVIAYEDPNFKGASLTIFPNIRQSCHKLPDEWLNRISSVDVVGGCVEICKDDNCEGPCKKLCSGVRGEKDLANANFNDLAVSFKRCTCGYQRLKQRPLG